STTPPNTTLFPYTTLFRSKEAMDLMMKEGFQQEGEAVAKWKRARLSSAQLSTYFVGVAEHLALRDRAKARDGTAFNLKNYNDTVDRKSTRLNSSHVSISYA